MKIKALVSCMVFFGALLLALPCLAADLYYVYCSQGKPVVDTRALSKFIAETGDKDARGLGRFNKLELAEKRAANAVDECAGGKVRTVEVPAKMPPGFVAMSDRGMLYAEAKAFCEQKGGRLPRVNNTDVMERADRRADGTPIEGFGVSGRRWGEVGLPDVSYWTATTFSDRPNASQGIIGNGGVVGFGPGWDHASSKEPHAICVPK